MYIQVNKSSLSQQIAENLENMILDQEFQVGERLPGEIDLADKFGASRNVVREALTMLRERGLVEVRNGSGAYVTQVGPQTLGAAVARITAVGSVSPHEVYEIRMALEVRACGLAAVNGTEEEKIKLAEIVQNMERDYNNLDKWNKHDRKFHRALAKMTHNALFPAMITPMIPLIFSKDDPAFVPPTDEMIQGGIEEHKDILNAVCNGDRSAAEESMARHLQTYLMDMITQDGKGFFV